VHAVPNLPGVCVGGGGGVARILHLYRIIWDKIILNLLSFIFSGEGYMKDLCKMVFGE
jgi:hypothetical protein